MTHSDDTPKSQQAVALIYDEKSAPRVVAKGKGVTAEQIIKLAQENDVPLYQSAELTQLLGTLDLEEEIPRSLYLAVAQVIAFAYTIKGKKVKF